MKSSFQWMKGDMETFYLCLKLFLFLTFVKLLLHGYRINILNVCQLFLQYYLGFDWPANPCAECAIRYTGLFNVKYGVQVRQLRKEIQTPIMSTHFCST